MHPIDEVLNEFEVNQTLVNGTELLLFYYALVITFFLLDLFISYKNLHSDVKRIKNKNIRFTISELYKFYKHYGLFAINSIVLVLCISIIIYNLGFEWSLIINVTISVMIYSVFMKIILRIIINKNNYENDATTRWINSICYILLGNFFCYTMSFISAPSLRVSLGGLTLALALCIYLMIHAIFDPKILQKSTKSIVFYNTSFGIIKGMLAVLVIMLATLYLMVYCCYRTSPGFYATTDSSVFNEWDLLYYLIVSFTTIGFGDIVPIRYNGLFYSRFVAILIGLTSLFTTACFVAAVISTTNSIASNTREEKKAREGATCF